MMGDQDQGNKRASDQGLSWNNYDIHVHFEHDQDRRRAKYHLQDVITGKILPADSRLALCLKRRRTGLNVNVVYSNKSKQSHYKNLWLCESSWACPICSGYKEGKRRKKMSSALPRPQRKTWRALPICWRQNHFCHRPIGQ